MGLGLLFIEVSRSHSETPHSVGLFWTGDWHVAETSTWQHTKLTRDIHAPAGFETADPAIQRPQTHALDRAATGIGPPGFKSQKNVEISQRPFIVWRTSRPTLEPRYAQLSYSICCPQCPSHLHYVHLSKPTYQGITVQTMGKVISPFSYSLFLRKRL
jgi:hypothetical protein